MLTILRAPLLKAATTILMVCAFVALAPGALPVFADADPAADPAVPADPYVNAFVRFDGDGGMPTAATLATRASFAAPPYRLVSFPVGATVQLYIVLGNNVAGTSMAGVTLSDQVPANLTGVTVLATVDASYAPSACATTSVGAYDASSGTTVSATVTDPLSAAGTLCRVLVQGTASTVTPSAGVDAVATITVPSSVGDTNPANNTAGVTVAIYTPTKATCGPTDLYAINERNNAVYKIDPVSGLVAVTGTIKTNDQLNGLGLRSDGMLYAFSQLVNDGSSTGSIYSYNPVTNVTAKFPTSVANTGLSGPTQRTIAGAVRSDGIYFYAWPSTALDDSGHRTLSLYAFNTNTNTDIGLVAKLTVPLAAGATGAGTGNNGDIAFDSDGNLYYTTETDAPSDKSLVALFPTPMPDVAGTPTIVGNIFSLSPASTNNNGVAFSAGGLVYTNGYNASGLNVVSTVDPGTGTVLSEVIEDVPVTNGRALVDFAGCIYPGTLELTKTVDGRVVPTDDFTITISRGETPERTATTGPGDGSGADTATTGSGIGVSNTSYTLSESGVGATVLADYSSTYECLDTAKNNTVVASGTGTSFSYTYPSPSAGHEVVCTFTNTPVVASPSLGLVKSVTPATYAAAGDTVTYHFAVTNTGDVALSGVTVAETAFSGTGALGALSCPETTLEVGQSIDCTASYTVTTADVTAGTVTNTAVATGTPVRGESVLSAPSSASITAAPAATTTTGLASTGSENSLPLALAGLLVLLLGSALVGASRRRHN